MTSVTFLIIFATILGFYMAWNIGANDVANAVGTSVGSGALTLFGAVIIAAIFEFAGAFFLGSSVSEMVEGGIVKPELFTESTEDFVYGMLGALLAASVWLQVASYFGWPVSTTHTIIGAVLGFGLIEGGVQGIYWGHIGSIVLSWVISPVMGGILSYVIFTIIRRRIFYQRSPIRAAKRLTPLFVFVMMTILSLIILFDGVHNLTLSTTWVLAISLGAGLISGLISYFFVRPIKEEAEEVSGPNIQVLIGLRKAQKHLGRVEAASLGPLHDQVSGLLDEVKDLTAKSEAEETHHVRSEYHTVEKIFISLQIVTACFMALAHGSNDVANAIGPLSAIINVLHGHSISEPQTVPVWLLFLGGVGIVFGLATWGWRVIETVGRKITELTPSRGFAAGFGAAVTILLASKLGLPISTTHVVVGTVLGVGFARGIGAINLLTIRDIVVSWVVTVPAGAVLSILFFYLIRALV